MNHYVIFFTFSIHKIIIVSGYKKIVKINIFKKVSLKGLTDMLTYSFADIGSDSLYEHLYKCIKNDIKKGVLEKNEKLPSKRSLAKNLGISVITVENAYAQLLAEGYIYSIAKKGYYVSDIKSGYIWDSSAMENEREKTSIKNGVEHINLVKEKMCDRIDEEFAISQARTEGRYIADFTKNKMISDMFPFTIWTKLIRQVLSEQQNALMTNPPSGGAMELRRAIAKHLKEFRGMIVAPEQIIVGAGTEYLYGLIIQLLGMDKKYGVEDPGYDKISKIYRCHGVKQDYIGMDEYGVIPSQISEKKIEQHIEKGRCFTLKEYQRPLNQEIPLIAGYDYQKVFHLNQKIKAGYLGTENCTFKIVGFLHKNTRLSSELNLDETLIMPTVSKMKTMKQENEKILMSVKCSGYFCYKNEKEYRQISNLLKRIRRETGYRYVIPQMKWKSNNLLPMTTEKALIFMSLNLLLEFIVVYKVLAVNTRKVKTLVYKTVALCTSGSIFANVFLRFLFPKHIKIIQIYSSDFVAYMIIVFLLCAGMIGLKEKRT